MNNKEAKAISSTDVDEAQRSLDNTVDNLPQDFLKRLLASNTMTGVGVEPLKKSIERRLAAIGEEDGKDKEE